MPFKYNYSGENLVSRNHLNSLQSHCQWAEEVGGGVLGRHAPL